MLGRVSRIARSARLLGFFLTAHANPAASEALDLISADGFESGITCDTTWAAWLPSCTSPECGNGIVQVVIGEECDGGDFLSAKCTDFVDCTGQPYTSGLLVCRSTSGIDHCTSDYRLYCTIDTSHCARCGNGVRETGEQCDGVDLGESTCQSLGFQGGTLSCRSFCSFDTSACT